MKYQEIKQVTKNLSKLTVEDRRTLARHWILARHYAKSKSIIKAENPERTRKAIKGKLLIGMLRLMNYKIEKVDDVFNDLKNEGFNVQDRNQNHYFFDQYSTSFLTQYAAILSPELNEANYDYMFIHRLGNLWDFPCAQINIEKSEFSYLNEKKNKKIVFKLLINKEKGGDFVYVFDFVYKNDDQMSYGTVADLRSQTTRAMIKEVLL